jgi:hypothetical protein
MVDECALTWTIGGVEMSPEAHCAVAASLLEREGAQAWHVSVARNAWRANSDRERDHVAECLSAARRSAPLLEVLEA